MNKRRRKKNVEREEKYWDIMIFIIIILNLIRFKYLNAILIKKIKDS